MYSNRMYSNRMYSQQDERRADLRLGTSRSTIGGYGCLLNVAAGALGDLRPSMAMTPEDLNRWLIRNNGYTGGNLFVFNALEPLGITLDAVIDCYRQAAPMDRVEQALRDSREVLALVDFKPGGAVGQHWVRLLDPVYVDYPRQPAFTDYVIHDPWLPEGKNEIRLLSRYALPTWDDAARAIFRLAIYRSAEDHEPFMPAAQLQREMDLCQQQLYPHPELGLLARLRARFA